MRPRFFPILIAFLAIAAAHLFGEMSGLRGLSFWTKIFLMPALAGWFWLESPPRPPRWGGGRTPAIAGAIVAGVAAPRLRGARRGLVSGLLLSWLGDCFLLFQKEGSGIPWFLLGLGAFLAAHLCYLTAFVKFPAAATSFLGKNKWLLLPFALFLLMMDGFLWPSLPGGLGVPVVVYSFAITAMAVGAAQLFGKMELRAAQIVFIGALFFICSDSLLAVNKFHAAFPGANFFIMLTYVLGQFGIAFGMWRGLAKV